MTTLPDPAPDVEWFAEQNRDAWTAGHAAGRQSVFADLQAAWDRGHDVGLGANQADRAAVHDIMANHGGGDIGHRAYAHAVTDGFNDGSLERKLIVQAARDHELAQARAARAERQAELEPRREAEAG